MSVSPFYDRRYEGIAESVFGISTSALVEDLEQLLTPRPKGFPVLDFGCGYGRIAGPLSQRGIDVVGIDRSEELIAIAQSRTPNRGNLRYLVGDIEVASSVRASGLLLIDSVLGDQLQDERRLLRRLSECLEPGSPVIINSLNLHAVVRHLGAKALATFTATSGASDVLDLVDFDISSGVLTTKRVMREVGQEDVMTHRLHLRSASEYAELLDECGFEVCGFFEEGGLGELRLDSPRLIMVATFAG